ncbi:hypothetical protein BDZ89DRAFT_1040733 [Hymenopellis radicata]|nr:hypothetical protein BDZ89DRAFT_1040733 [Hymenopellis radicata]
MPHRHPPAIAEGASVVHDANNVRGVKCGGEGGRGGGCVAQESTASADAANNKKKARNTDQSATSPADDVAAQNPPPRSSSALLSAAGCVPTCRVVGHRCITIGRCVLPVCEAYTSDSHRFYGDDMKSSPSWYSDADTKSSASRGDDEGRRQERSDQISPDLAVRQSPELRPSSQNIVSGLNKIAKNMEKIRVLGGCLPPGTRGPEADTRTWVDTCGDTLPEFNKHSAPGYECRVHPRVLAKHPALVPRSNSIKCTYKAAAYRVL